MTDRFKEALNAVVSTIADYGDDDPERSLDTEWGNVDIRVKHLEDIREALTLATEAEQLRKERDELAKDILYIADHGRDLEIFDKAKRIIENGNA